jgi:hypothetical protein
MVVLDMHLREDCSDAEKLANIDSFKRDYMTSSQMDKRQFVLHRNAKFTGKNTFSGCFVQLQNLSECDGHPVQKYMEKVAILYIEFFHRLISNPKTIEVGGR